MTHCCTLLSTRNSIRVMGSVSGTITNIRFLAIYLALTSPCFDTHHQGAMAYYQPPWDDLHGANNQRIAGGDVISTGRTTPFLLADGICPRQLVLHRSTSTYTQRLPPSSVAGNLYMQSSRREKMASLVS